MNLQDIISLIGREEEKDYFINLCRSYFLAQQRSQSTDPQGGGDTAADILRQIMDRLHLYFLAIRHPLPSANELRQMILAHFDSGEDILPPGPTLT